MQFRAVVEADMRRRPEEREGNPESVALRSEPDAIERWYRVLVSMKSSVESQLGARKLELNNAKRDLEDKGVPMGSPEWNALQSEFDRWKAGSLRFKAGMEAALEEARTARNTLFNRARELIAVDERNEALHQTMTLINAIKAHRDHLCADRCTDDFCVADEELWAFVAGR